MNDFVSRLVARSRGAAPMLQPRRLPRFATPDTEATPPGFVEDEASARPTVPSGRIATIRAATPFPVAPATEFRREMHTQRAPEQQEDVPRARASPRLPKHEPALFEAVPPEPDQSERAIAGRGDDAAEVQHPTPVPSEREKHPLPPPVVRSEPLITHDEEAPPRTRAAPVPEPAGPADHAVEVKSSLPIAPPQPADPWAEREPADAVARHPAAHATPSPAATVPEPSVVIEIGSIEFRAPAPPPPVQQQRPAARRTASLRLDAYLAKRGEAR
jgi:hypothetical protein